MLLWLLITLLSMHEALHFERPVNSMKMTIGASGLTQKVEITAVGSTTHDDFGEDIVETVGNWTDLGAGCCVGDRKGENVLFKGKGFFSLEACQQKCETFPDCGAVDWGWKCDTGTCGNFCFVWSSAQQCSSVIADATSCGSSGNNGVHSWRYNPSQATPTPDDKCAHETCTPTTESCDSKDWREQNFCTCKCNELRPNLVFLMLDDLGFNDFLKSDDMQVAWSETKKIHNNEAPYGGRSSLIDSTYTEALCAPSRSAFMSGRFLHYLTDGGFSWKVGMSSKEVSIAQKLGDVGYMSYMVGKWHVGYTTKKHIPTGRGFHRYFGNYANIDHYKHCDYKSQTGNEDTVTWKLPTYDMHYEEAIRFESPSSFQVSHDNPYHRFPTEVIGKYIMSVYDEKARQFIADHQTTYPEKPFFLYYAPYSFHYPMEAPQKYHDRCTAKEFSTANSERFAMCAMTMAVDDAIGKLVEMLVTLDRKSVVIITSDNAGSAWKGYVANNNWPLRGNKGEPFEGGVRNHALVWSNFGEFFDSKRNYDGRRGFMHLVDWHATLANLGHGTLHSQVEDPSMNLTMGISMWETLRKSTGSSPRTWMYNSWRGESFRVGKYKLYKDVQVGENHKGQVFGHHWPVRQNQSHAYLEQQRDAQTNGALRTVDFLLFDLEADPEERDDLISTHADKKDEILQQWNEVKNQGVRSNANEEKRGLANAATVASSIPNFASVNRCSNDAMTDYHTEIGIGHPGGDGTQSSNALLPGDLPLPS